MTAITSAGIGSGLDVNNIVTQLVAAERGPSDQRLGSAQSKAQTKISALAALRSALANLQTAADALKTSSTGGFAQLKATAAVPDYFSATASSKAVAGSYNVEVLALAAASKRSSDAFASSSAVVGTGDVTIAVGAKSFTVSLASGANTLADLRDKINAATDNSGVGAAIVSDAGGARLLLTSRDTGTANALTVTTSLFGTSEVQPAADAQIKLDGYSYTSSSNTVTGAVDGLTLNLTKAAPGTTTTLNVSLDQAATSTLVQKFVTAYNMAAKFIAGQTAYDPTSNTGGTLLGDSTVLATSQQLRNALSANVADAGTFSSLTQVGITTGADGTLSVDSGKLNDALAKDFGSVQRLFGGASGVATSLSAFTKTLLADDGQLKAKTDGLNSTLKDIAKQQDALNVRIAAYEKRTRAQFTALDTLMSKLNSTSTYLSQQLAKL